MSGMNQSAVIDALKGQHSARIIRKVLPAQVGRYWNVHEGERNSAEYVAIRGIRLSGNARAFPK
jgi:hypothetical protein